MPRTHNSDPHLRKKQSCVDSADPRWVDALRGDAASLHLMVRHCVRYIVSIIAPKNIDIPVQVFETKLMMKAQVFCTNLFPLKLQVYQNAKFSALDGYSHALIARQTPPSQRGAGSKSNPVMAQFSCGMPDGVTLGNTVKTLKFVYILVVLVSTRNDL